MQQKNTILLRSPRRLAPLAGAVLLACGHLASANPSSTVVVQNCNDHGTGSLRRAVANAVSGTTIDLSQLPCSTITLSTGSIEIPQASLTLTGPGASQLTINGGDANQHYNRVIHHTGTGSLTITGMTLTGAKYQPNGAEAFGACVYSRGSAIISESTLTGCFAIASNNNDAKGGAVYAVNGLTLLNSSITGSFAYAKGAGNASGGGIYCHGPLTVKYSTISNNSAVAPNGNYVNDGGIHAVAGDVVMFDTTVSNNYSGGGIGGMQIAQFNGDPAHTARIINSTISNNKSMRGVAGLNAQNPLTLANSTIAFNSSETGGGFGAGVEMQASVNMQSTIIAENSSNIGDDDFYSVSAVSGANNLVTQHGSGTTALPLDTITACPLLGRLSDNGGPTLTLRLLPNSPALDAGNNDTGFGDNPLLYDQRGSGHTRTYNNVTDIGAFEYAGGTADDIFRSGFEGRCR